MLRLLVRILPVILLLTALGASPAFAQNGRVSGQVSDHDGGVISGATVQVINQDTTAKREIKTEADGSYSVPFLAPGNYQVIVAAPGFSTILSQVIPLTAGQTFVFNVQLTVGGEHTEVSVNGSNNATSVELDTASISTTLSEKEVSGYGLNGRNFSQLITMAPGVSNQTGQDEAKVGVAGSAKFSVNGGRVEYNTFEVDGSDVLNTSINASRGQGEPLMVYPSIDAINEMKVLTADYSALYGKSASGSVLVTTKSGSDKFHGNVYEFIRNEMFNARNYFDQVPQAALADQPPPRKRTPLYRRQDFGVTIGGPLFIPHVYNTSKSKTFFFFSEEMRREKTPVDYNQAVPTMAERAGDFSDVCPIKPLVGPDTLNLSQKPDCPHAIGTAGIPQRTISVGYTSAAILNSGIIPQPNSSVGCNTTNPSVLPRCYVASVSPFTYWREELFRIDHNLTSSEVLSFRYIHDAWNTTTLTPQWGVVQNSFPTVENQLNGPGLNMEVMLTQSLPHAFLNRLSFSYAVEHISLQPQAGPGLSSLDRPAALDDDTSLGGTPVAGASLCSVLPGASGTTFTACPMGYIFANGFGGDKMPGLEFQGSNGAYGGHGFAADTGYAPWSQSNPTYVLRDDASKTIGKHTVQFGFYGSINQQNEFSAVSGANSGDLQGLLTFSNQQSLYTTGNAFADFLSGPGPTSKVGALNQSAIKSYTQDSAQAKYYNRYKMAEVYLQDDWHALSRLTLNFGFRGSFFGTWYNAKGTAYNWRPEYYNPSLGSSIGVDSTYGFVFQKGNGIPVPLSAAGSLGTVATNGLTQCGKNGVPLSCMQAHIFNPAPRFGFSWDVFGNGKTAVRGGYGLFWEHGTGYEANSGSLIGSAPMILSETQSNVPSTYPRNSSNGDVGSFNTIGFSCQQGATQCGTVSNLAAATPTFPLNVTSIPTKAVYSYTQQWSLSVQHELHKNTVAQLAYVGTKGTHLTAVRDLNELTPLSPTQNPFGPHQPITPGVCTTGAQNQYFSVNGINPSGPTPIIPSSPGIGVASPGYNNMLVACTGNPGFVDTQGALLGLSADDVRRYPGFSNIISVENVADSVYHAFQGTLRETAGPLTVGVAYTFSHSIDDASDRSSANFTNSLDIHSNRASSDFDQRQLLNISYIYDLPLWRLLRGFSHFVGSGSDAATDAKSTAPQALQPAAIWKTILDGWQWSGITTHQSGTPFSVVNGGGADGTGPADNAGVGDGLGVGSYADVIGNPHSGKPRISSNSNLGPLLLNPGAFVAPRGLTFGNSGRNYLRNPSRTNFNMALLKHFTPFGQGRILEFRAEAFNVFNHTQFRIYDPSHPGNTGNNVINCYGPQTSLYSAGYAGNGTASDPGCLVGNSFLHPVDAHDPRILQFGLKLAF